MREREGVLTLKRGVGRKTLKEGKKRMTTEKEQKEGVEGREVSRESYALKHWFSRSVAFKVSGS